MQYSRYKELIPPRDEPLKDTLYWEFSKILFGYLDDRNPATLISINLWVADMADVMLTETMQVEEILTTT